MENWAYFDEKYGAPFAKGAQCQVYRKGDGVVKVLTPGHQLVDVMREAYALSVVESLGIPTSNLRGAYREQGHLVMEMRYVPGKELMDEILACAQQGDLASAAKHLEVMADMQIKMHASQACGLGETRTLYASSLARAEGVDAQTKKKLIAQIDALPGGTSLCHNDYHARNILYDGEHYTIIDWDSATVGDPAGDLAHTYLTTLITDRTIADEYLKIYLSKSGMDRARIDQWLPLHAAVLYNALLANEESAPHGDVLKPFLP